MATITIPALPVQDTFEPSNLIVVQDGGDTKQMAVSVMVADTDARIAAHVNDLTAAHAASSIGAVPNPPTMPGTTVQLQLDQIQDSFSTLNTGVIDLSQDFAAHVNDLVDAHDASAISAVAQPLYMTGTTVQDNLALIEQNLLTLYSTPIRRPIKAVATATYAPILSDENTMITLSNASPITVTMPSNATQAFVIGTEIDFLWLGVGQPTFVAGAGSFLNATPSLKMRAQFSGVTAKKINTNSWVLFGDLAS